MNTENNNNITNITNRTSVSHKKSLSRKGRTSVSHKKSLSRRGRTSVSHKKSVVRKNPVSHKKKSVVGKKLVSSLKKKVNNKINPICNIDFNKTIEENKSIYKANKLEVEIAQGIFATIFGIKHIIQYMLDKCGRSDINILNIESFPNYIIPLEEIKKRKNSLLPYNGGADQFVHWIYIDEQGKMQNSYFYGYQIYTGDQFCQTHALLLALYRHQLTNLFGKGRKILPKNSIDKYKDEDKERLILAFNNIVTFYKKFVKQIIEELYDNGNDELIKFIYEAIGHVILETNIEHGNNSNVIGTKEILNKHLNMLNLNNITKENVKEKKKEFESNISKITKEQSLELFDYLLNVISSEQAYNDVPFYE